MKKSEFPEVIVGGLILNQDNLMLLGKSRKWHGKYTVFGGHVELGESLKEAIKREVKEETGLNVEIEKKIGFSDSVFHKDFHQKKHFIFVDFICRYDGDKDAIKLDEKEYLADEYIWVDPEGALKMDIAVGTKDIINRYLEEKKKDDYLSGWQRCLADFENYKKRQLESQRFLGNHIKEDLILQILPVIDNFEASLVHIPTDKKDDGWVTGIMYIQKQLENILKENNVLAIETKVGDEFNPEIHEAVQKEEEKAKTNEIDPVKSPQGGVAESEFNRVKEVVQKGYKMGDKIIRAVRVIVK